MSYHRLKTTDGAVFNTKDISLMGRENYCHDITYYEFRQIIKKGYFVCLLYGNKAIFKACRDEKETRECIKNESILFVNNDVFSQILIDVYGDFIINFCHSTRDYTKVNSKTLNYRVLSMMIFVFFGIITFAFFLPQTNYVVKNIIFFYYIIVFFTKGFCVFFGLILEIFERCFVKKKQHHDICDEELPVYTILVPMFKEKRKTILQMINGLSNLQYPKERLDVKFVLEECDEETRRMVEEILNENKSIVASKFIHIINVPKFSPQTKPKACNVASLFALGEYIVIFDAEDMPSSTQLTKSLFLFSAHKQDEEIFCTQGNLCFYNYNKNILTSFFNIEYNTHFKLLLKVYSFFKIKLPLGGTSNHFNFHSLEKCKFWDSYNVTEDVEISSIVDDRRGRIIHLDSNTMEWCVEDLKSWVKQRTRWMKGYLLTYYLCIVRDLSNKKRINFRAINFKSISNVVRSVFFKYIIVGSQVVVFLLSPYLLISLLFFNVSGIFYYILTVVTLSTYFITIIWYLFLIKRKYRTINMLSYISCLLYPLYFILHMITSYIALVDLIRRPFYWSKTEHKC